MLAVGAFSYAAGRGFVKYMPQFYPYLRLGLGNHQEWQVGEGVEKHGGGWPCRRQQPSRGAGCQTVPWCARVPKCTLLHAQCAR